MSEAPFAGLSVSSRARSAGGDGAQAVNGPIETKDFHMTEQEHKQAVDAARAEGEKAGFAAANARYETVLNSEEYAGREGLAAKLLGNADFSAEQIIDTLSAAERKTEQKAEEPDAEAAAREDMQAAIKAQGNDAVEAADRTASDDPALSAAGVWEKAYQSLGFTKPAA